MDTLPQQQLKEFLSLFKIAFKIDETVKIYDKMFVIQMFFVILLNKLLVEAMDPELDLCSDLSIDSAVSADDGIDYIIKGDYYWQFSTGTGISPDFIARPISERWPGLSGPIDAAFAIDEAKYRFSTVFLKVSIFSG